VTDRKKDGRTKLLWHIARLHAMHRMIDNSLHFASRCSLKPVACTVLRIHILLMDTCRSTIWFNVYCWPHSPTDDLVRTNLRIGMQDMGDDLSGS